MLDRAVRLLLEDGEQDLDPAPVRGYAGPRDQVAPGVPQVHDLQVGASRHPQAHYLTARAVVQVLWIKQHTVAR